MKKIITLILATIVALSSYAQVNDQCSNATTLTVNTSCTPTSGTTVGATPSTTIIGCAGNADDDVWYKFTATNSVATINVQGGVGFDAVVELLSGTCGTFTSLNCEDASFSGDLETVNAVGLTSGKVYYVRVHDYYTNNTGTFTICVSGPANTTIPINDAVCNAIQLPAVNAGCNYLRFTTTNATPSTGAGIPTPTSCSGGGAPQIGGFNTSTTGDVWFKVTVPANGKLALSGENNYGLTDAVMALYSGSCTSLTQIACSDETSLGSAVFQTPTINRTGLTPGATLYIRYWGFGATKGNFGLCVSSPDNDVCSSALDLCDLDGYSGSTSFAYTVDRPCNMAGNCEDPANGFTADPGVNHGGPFGQAPSFAGGVGNAGNTVGLNNNSWIKFKADATTATLNVNIGDCWRDTKGLSSGCQMQIFSTTGSCCGFTAVSDFKQDKTSFTIQAKGLTAGNSYYLMIDGYANDICNYTITAISGVNVGNINSTKDTICIGNAVTLNAPAGGTSYTWSPGFQNTPSITVSPNATSTYTVSIAGYCGKKQTRSKTIVVNPLPTPNISPNSTVGCKGGASTYTVTASSGSSYAWTVAGGTIASGQGTNTLTVTWGVGATGSVKITQTTKSCEGKDSLMNISLTNAPTNNFSYVSPVCAGSPILLYPTIPAGSAAASGTFTSTPGLVMTSGNGIIGTTLSTAGTYTVTNTVPASGGCPTVSSIATVTINPKPIVKITTADTIICANDTGIFKITNTASTIVWTVNGGIISTGGATKTMQAIFGSTSPAKVLVQVTNSFGCKNKDSVTVKINSLPTKIVPIITADDTLCSGETVTINATPQAGVTSTIYGVGTGGTAFGTLPYTSPILNSSISYYIETKNTAGCFANNGRDTVRISVNPRPAPPILNTMPNDSICFGLVATIKAVKIAGVMTNVYASLTGGSPLGTLNYITQPITATTTYYFATVDTLTGCTANNVRGSLTIVVLPRPVKATINYMPNDSICLHDSTLLKATSAGNTINWYTTATNLLSIGKDSAKVSPSLTQYYYVEVKNTLGCKAAEKRDSVLVTVLPLPQTPQLNGNYNEICEGDSIVLSAYTVPTTATIYWLSGPRWESVIATGPDFTSPNIITNTTYYMASVSLQGCKSNGAFTIVPVVVKPLPHVTIESNMPNNTVYEGQVISFSAQPSTYDMYKWYIQNIKKTEGNNLFETQDLKDNDTVKVLVTQNGCPNWSDNTLKIKVLPISNAFTPNNDGKNDVFLKGLDMNIFNRWGQLLYTGNDGWDGKYKGNAVSAGTYYYIIKIKKLNSDEVIEKSGAVTVVLD
ncbi:MAG: gliding motility-associated C-terminal domain-containing protein [Bacteroidia bacterium]|nr:gliding motility-associated C-terminal domain-containing protein [Bacteroidia bacterium]